MTAATVVTQEAPVFETEVPVIVVGAGAAGLVAALSCHGAGVEPLVIERDPVPRGSTSLSAGLMSPLLFGRPGVAWTWNVAVGAALTLAAGLALRPRKAA